MLLTSLFGVPPPGVVAVKSRRAILPLATVALGLGTVAMTTTGTLAPPAMLRAAVISGSPASNWPLAFVSWYILMLPATKLKSSPPTVGRLACSIVAKVIESVSLPVFVTVYAKLTLELATPCLSLVGSGSSVKLLEPVGVLPLSGLTCTP